jgi:stage II sporulation protein M
MGQDLPCQARKEEGNPLRDKFIKPYMHVVCFLFLLSLFVGYITPYHYQQEIAKKLLTYFSPLESSTQAQLFIKIFLNNYISTLLSLLLGLFFGIGPIVFLIINGYTLGNLISFASSKVGIYKIGLAIIPHGIFEVPAVLLAASYGLWWGVKNYRKIRYRENFQDDFPLPIKRYIIIIIPLLLIGAFVEAYITPFVYKLFS